jgi:hypothetical protein
MVIPDMRVTGVFGAELLLGEFSSGRLTLPDRLSFSAPWMLHPLLCRTGECVRDSRRSGEA